MPEKVTTYQDRLLSLRKEIQAQSLDGFVMLRTDEFQGEFLAPYAERLSWLCSFTGSAGQAIILKDHAVIMSDGRYTIQLQDQVPNELFSTEDSTKTSIGQWLASNISCNTSKENPFTIGYDIWLHTPKQIAAIEEKLQEHENAGENAITLIGLEQNPIDAIWHDQPAKPSHPVTIFPHEIAGQTSEQKRQTLAKTLKQQGAQSCLISAGDSICWILNIRGHDIEYSPLVLSYALLHDNGTLDWFVDKTKITKDITDHIGENVNIHPFESISSHIETLSGTLWLDRGTTPIALERAAQNAKLPILDQEDPCIQPKAIKSKSEQHAIKAAHIADGIALVKFIQWFEENVNNTALSELSVEEKLESFRRENPAYLEPSFSTIAGYAENGAIIHYRADEKTNKAISGDGLLLIDSGGQYRWGTTDITRTLPVGTPSQEMRENYTRVLKGHIALASARFPQGTIGKEIDALARRPLQEAGLDYAHGTGHGVGCYLCVHENAASISPRGEKPFKAGMLISNEPGYYKENEYGIRIETLVLVQTAKDDGNMLEFETVTRAPFAQSLILHDMLSDEEGAWLNEYNQQLLMELSPHLNTAQKQWLSNKVNGTKV